MSDACGWALKGYAAQPNQHANEREWLEYTQNPRLRPIVPELFGHVTATHSNGACTDCLLCERIALTLAEVVERLQASPPTCESMAIVTKRAAKAVAQMIFAATDLELACSEWHLGNIAFADTEHAPALLIDFETACEARG